MTEPKGPYTVDLHALYESAVQNVDADVDFLDETFTAAWGRPPELLREDFCGSASLCAEFVGRRPTNRAWGVDLHEETLAWGREHRVAPLGPSADRVELVLGDVREPATQPVEVVCAFNFSFFVFHGRAGLRDYFQAAFDNLVPGGMFFLDTFGGTESLQSLEEDTDRDEKVDPDGRRVPALTYTWEQVSFNPVDHSLQCSIHLRVKRNAGAGVKKKLRHAFRYDWRYWTLPELREILTEVGFEAPVVYTEGWDEEDEEGDGDFQPVDEFDNEGSWIAYVSARRPPEAVETSEDIGT